MKPIYKFNSGMGGMICNICRTIISTGPATKELYCEKCKLKQNEKHQIILYGKEKKFMGNSNR